MGRLKQGLIGAVVMGALPVAADAQATFALDTSQTGSQKTAEVGGTPTVDIVSLSASGPGTPLRFGNIVPNSETVQFGGMRLVSGTDYLMDYGVGVVYLMVAQRAGQVLTVSYRYKPGAAAATAPTGQVAGLTTFKYALLPGAVNMLSGLGMAERATDGTVASSNVYGWNNTLKLGGSSSLNGVYIAGDRQKVNATAGLSLEQSAAGPKSSIESGKSQLILQDLKSKVLGGEAQLDYQDVSKNFSSFGTASAAGLDDATVKRLTSEKGLTRLGFSTKDLKVGSLQLSNSYRTVGDKMGGVTWRDYGVATNGLKLNWSSQVVDQHFDRAKDLADPNAAQLAKEGGLERQNLSGEWAHKFGKISYTDSNIKDTVTNNQISTKTWALEAGKYKFNMGNETVDSGFMRFDSLMAPEKVSFGREAGIKRQWLGLQAGFLGKETPLNYNQSSVTSTAGKFQSQDVVVLNKTWSLQHSERKVSEKFISMGSMSDVDINDHIKTIASMYGTGINPTPNDRAEFLNTHGLDRKFDGFSTDSIKGVHLTGSELSLKGVNDTGKLDTFAISSKNVLMSYRHENLGKLFSEVNSMMDFEKQRLGTVAGLDRTDMSLAYAAGKRKLNIDNFVASTPSGDAQRTTLAYSDPRINIQAGARKVSDTFTDAPNLIDPERDLINKLKGFKEQDLKVQWQLRNDLHLDNTTVNEYNPTNNQTWKTQNTILDWAPDKFTKLNVTDLEQHNSDSMKSLFDSSVERISLIRNMGRYGTLTLLDEKDEFGGVDVAMKSQKRQYLGYEAKVTATTSFKTEQTRTTYENGTHENINSNTISTEITKRAGVSWTDTKIDRQGSNDESHKTYGFWYDMGGGVRVSYGYAQQVLPQDQGTSNSTFMVGKAPNPAVPVGQTQQVQQGQVGDFNLGGGYFANQWDAGNRTQTNGTVGVSNAKPLKFWFMRDIKFNVNLDTATDKTAMLRENKLVGITGAIGASTFGLEYKGQMDPTGLRAIDRTIKFQSDQSEKKAISVGISYKMRTLPNDQEIAIRDFNIMMRPAKNVTLTNQIQTNPDVANPTAILGSIPQASRSNKWRLDFKQGPNLTIGYSWEELLNDQNHSMSRTSGLTAKLFEKSGSPVTLFLGVEQADQANLWRTTKRYSIQFDQKPSVNQTFSLLIGSLSYEHSVPTGYNPYNLTLRLNYQVRF